MKHHGLKIDPRLVPALINGTKTLHVERMEPQPAWVPRKKNSLSAAGWYWKSPCGGFCIKSFQEIDEVVLFEMAEYAPIQPGDVVFLQEEWASYGDKKFRWWDTELEKAVAGEKFDQSKFCKYYAETMPFEASRWHAIVKSVEARQAKDITLNDTNRIYGSGPRDKFSESGLNSEDWIWLYTFEKGE